MLRASSRCNLPGWRWAAITKVALDRLSRSLHSDVCDSDGCCDAVVHSTISGSGNRRTRAVPNISKDISPAHVRTGKSTQVWLVFDISVFAFGHGSILTINGFFRYPCGRGNSATSDA